MADNRYKNQPQLPPCGVNGISVLENTMAMSLQKWFVPIVIKFQMKEHLSVGPDQNFLPLLRLSCFRLHSAATAVPSIPYNLTIKMFQFSQNNFNPQVLLLKFQGHLLHTFFSQIHAPNFSAIFKLNFCHCTF